jgi:hypothetical protein
MEAVENYWAYNKRWELKTNNKLADKAIPKSGLVENSVLWFTRCVWYIFFETCAY